MRPPPGDDLSGLSSRATKRQPVVATDNDEGVCAFSISNSISVDHHEHDHDDNDDAAEWRTIRDALSDAQWPIGSLWL